MEIVKQLSNAKKNIRETKMKKEGKNTFSNYEYFTPSQVEKLVSDACAGNNLLPVFELKRNELGVYGVLTVYSTLSDEKLTFEMATAIPEIKATNIAQQLGGCVTYTERYLKQSVFGITDNSLDFDTTENTKQTAAPKQTAQSQKQLPNEKEIELAKKTLEACQSLENLKKTYTALEPHLKIALKKYTIYLKTKLENLKRNENII